MTVAARIYQGRSVKLVWHPLAVADRKCIMAHRIEMRNDHRSRSATRRATLVIDQIDIAVSPVPRGFPSVTPTITQPPAPTPSPTHGSTPWGE